MLVAVIRLSRSALHGKGGVCGTHRGHSEAGNSAVALDSTRAPYDELDGGSSAGQNEVGQTGKRDLRNNIALVEGALAHAH